jgi:hypothetical protein
LRSRGASAKARLLPLCRDPADAIFLCAQISADIETLAGIAPTGVGAAMTP